MVWFKFFLCVVIILFSGTKLARYGDAIAEKTGLGGLWIGLVLVAAITSMPELVTGVTAAALVALPDLAMGNLLGSNLFNLTLITVMDILYRSSPILSQASIRHVASAGAGILLIAIAGGGILAGEWISGLVLGWVGIPSIIIFILYLVAVRQLFRYERSYQASILPASSPKYEASSTKAVWFKFALAAAAVVGAGIWLSSLGDEIAETYRWSNSFVGSLFLAVSTSMPELVVTVAALRLGAIDMAVADILGSNMFNLAIILPVDLFYVQGSILAEVSADHLITVAVVIIMTILVMVGLRFRQKRKTFFVISWYALALIGLYIFGVYALFISGAGLR